MEREELTLTEAGKRFSKSSAAVREWMEWNEEESKFKNILNFNEFVGWLYPRPTEEDGAAPQHPG
jgi:hypothetical protein